jgi:hypothetical protein
MTVFTMFFIELMASRFDVFGDQDHNLEASDPSKEVMRHVEKRRDEGNSAQKGKQIIFLSSNLLIKNSTSLASLMACSFRHLSEIATIDGLS